jgi:septum formation protein
VNEQPILLASRSPQRRAILDQLGVPFRAEAPVYDELPLDLPAPELVVHHSRGKAASLEARPGERAVLGVDTDVELDGRLLGKAASEDEARALLLALRGREHRVLSGVTVRDGAGERSALEATIVRFRAFGDDELDWYLAFGEWRERAGAYAVQGHGARLVESIDGCYLNVVGLPGPLVLRLLAGYPPNG